jgi:hypothetical protein
MTRARSCGGGDGDLCVSFSLSTIRVRTLSPGGEGSLRSTSLLSILSRKRGGDGDRALLSNGLLLKVSVSRSLTTNWPC